MATFVSDTFTDTDNTNLSAHTGETGATWAKHTSYTADATIISNQAKVSSGTAMYYASGNPTNADYYAAMDIIRSGSGALGVACRVNTAAHTFYYAQHYTNWQLYKAVAGTHTQLGSNVAQTLTAGVAYNMKLECNGSSISLYKEGGATPAIGPITDTAITAAGKAGLRGYLNGYVGDNFQAADLSTVYYQVNAGSFPTPTGGAYKGMFQALTGAMPAPSGIVGSTKVFLLTVVGALGSLYAGIVKQVNKGLSGDVPAGSAGVKKGVAVVRSGNMPGGSGGLNAGVTLHQTLTGIMGSIAAIVTTVLNPIVVIGVKLFKVIGSAFKKLVGG